MDQIGVLTSIIRKTADCEMNLYFRRVTKTCSPGKYHGEYKNSIFNIVVVRSSLCMHEEDTDITLKYSNSINSIRHPTTGYQTIRIKNPY